MKKKLLIAAILAAVVLAVLLVPWRVNTLKDGGTKEYRALIYRVVAWNRLSIDGNYQKTRVYFGRDLSKDLDELWQREEPYVEHRFVARVSDYMSGGFLAAPVEGEMEGLSNPLISVSFTGLDEIGADVGSLVEITYRGKLPKSGALQPVSVTLAQNLRFMEYTGSWLDAETTKNVFMYSVILKITKIYSNCFFGEWNEPHGGYQCKINGKLSEEWCVGDMVMVSCENLRIDGNNRYEGNMIMVTDYEDRQGGMTYDKPVIYLYPEEETEVSVRLTLDGKLTCTYPAYGDGWTVTAKPDGTLTDATGQTYSYLYWEGQSNADYDLSQGFCVRGEDTAVFLEDALEKLGLTRREANEFIVYWLPLMEQNPYNIISFQTDVYTDAARLDISPTPDTLIRVFMAWQAAEEYVELLEQALTAPERQGFTVVEWGGTEIK